MNLCFFYIVKIAFKHRYYLYFNIGLLTLFCFSIKTYKFHVVYLAFFAKGPTAFTPLSSSLGEGVKILEKSLLGEGAEIFILVGEFYCWGVCT